MKRFLLFFFALFLIFRPFIDGLTYSVIQHLFEISTLCVALFFAGAVLAGFARYQRTGVELPALLFFLFILAGSFFTTSPYRTAVIDLQYLYYFLLFFLFYQLASTEELGHQKKGIKKSDKSERFPEVKRVLVPIILFTGFLVSLYGIHQYFWGFRDTLNYLSERGLLKGTSPDLLARIYSKRAFATFVYPNIFAAYLITLIPLTFSFAFANGIPWKKDEETNWNLLFGIPLLLLLFLALFTTKSAGGLIIFFSVTILWLVTLQLTKKGVKNSGKQPAFFLIILVVAIVFLTLYSSGFFSKALSLRDRLFYWLSSFQIWTHRPLFGFGSGTFGLHYARFKMPLALETQHSHSIFFEMLAENGILCLATFFWFWLLVLKKIWKNARSPIEKGIFWGVLTLFLHSQIDFDLADPSLATYLFLLPALVPDKSEPKPLSDKKRRENLLLTRITAGIIILTMLLAGLRLFRIFRSERYYQRALASLSAGGVEEGMVYLHKASALEPRNAFYPLTSGNVCYKLGIVTGNLDSLYQAINYYQKAVELEPFGASFRFRLGEAALAISKISGNQDWKEYAKLCFEAAVRLYPTKKEYRERWLQTLKR